MTRSDVAKGHPEYYQDARGADRARTPGALLHQPVRQPGQPARARDNDRPGDLGADGARARRGRLRRRLRRHDHRAVALLRSASRRRPRWCSPIPRDRCSRTTSRPARSRGRRVVAGRRHRRGFHAAGVRPVAREEGLHHPRRRGVRACCATLLKNEGILAGTSSGTLIAGRAALLPRADDAEARGHVRLRQRQQVPLQGLQRLLDARPGLHQARDLRRPARPHLAAAQGARRRDGERRRDGARGATSA